MNTKETTRARLTTRELTGDEITLCRDLCNELMAYQKSQAKLLPEVFDQMTFETRMVPSYRGAMHKKVLVVEDGSTPIAYMFATVDLAPPEAREAFPPWAQSIKSDEKLIGFYPDSFELPQLVGSISNMYIKPEYRGLGLGLALFDAGMEWLMSFPELEHAFLFVSNGNESVMDIYCGKRGFTYSHPVFGGFITAVYKKLR